MNHPLRRSFLTSWIAFVFACTASATSNHEYKPDEYVPIVRGVSPDGRYSIATHGEGYLGYDNFQLYLIDAKTHKPIAGLKEPKEPFVDTGADAYYAGWSADSKQVSIILRAERHLAVRLRYRIENGRAHLLQGRTRVEGLPRD
jgi:hypothetical protein